ncbi:MAG: DASS family sodium-coupled anion symporter [Alphaproteobacteria bacterium]|nr:DASS family sodium-coupled anion symporter [Alphaproteobacteria bacterium]
MPRLLATLLVLGLPLAVALGVGGAQALPTACFVSVVALWFTELLPLAVTGLLVPVLCVAYGLMDAKQAFGAFGNPILFLFLGSFLLVRGMQAHGLDQRIASLVLSRRWATRSVGTLTAFLALTCWLLSMWMSNTATCAIMTPVVLGVVDTLGPRFPDEAARKAFASRALLLTAFASSIGGLATPMGSPPNLLALSFLADEGITLGVLDWMAFGLPVAALMLVALLGLLAWRYPVPPLDLAEVRQEFAARLRDHGRPGRGERAVAACFLAAVAMWLLPGVAGLAGVDEATVGWLEARLPLGGVAVAAALPLFVLPGDEGRPVLTWEEALHIDWGTILLFGGGLCLGTMLDHTGLAGEVGRAVFGGGMAPGLTLGAVVAFAVLLSEFGSNTASAAVLVPLLTATFPGLGADALTALVVAAALGASFGFMLPVSTPPNAIVFGTGRVPARDMASTGVLFDVLGWGVLSLALAVFFLT